MWSNEDKLAMDWKISFRAMNEIRMKIEIKIIIYFSDCFDHDILQFDKRILWNLTILCIREV